MYISTNTRAKEEIREQVKTKSRVQTFEQPTGTKTNTGKLFV